MLRQLCLTPALLKPHILSVVQEGDMQALRNTLVRFGAANVTALQLFRDAVGEECPICMAPLDEGGSDDPPVMTKRCGHIFHKGCLALLVAGGNTACPTCRKDQAATKLIHRPVDFAE